LCLSGCFDVLCFSEVRMISIGLLLNVLFGVFMGFLM
jgi:hypothetical protein